MRSLVATTPRTVRSRSVRAIATPVGTPREGGEGPTDGFRHPPVSVLVMGVNSIDDPELAT
jgi:hypothetical protein